MWHLQLSNNNFEWKNVIFWGGREVKTYILTSRRHFQGVKTPTPRIYAHVMLYSLISHWPRFTHVLQAAHYTEYTYAVCCDTGNYLITWLRACALLYCITHTRTERERERESSTKRLASQAGASTSKLKNLLPHVTDRCADVPSVEDVPYRRRHTYTGPYWGYNLSTSAANIKLHLTARCCHITLYTNVNWSCHRLRSSNHLL